MAIVLDFAFVLLIHPIKLHYGLWMTLLLFDQSPLEMYRVQMCTYKNMTGATMTV